MSPPRRWVKAPAQLCYRIYITLNPKNEKQIHYFTIERGKEKGERNLGAIGSDGKHYTFGEAPVRVLESVLVNFIYQGFLFIRELMDKGSALFKHPEGKVMEFRLLAHHNMILLRGYLHLLGICLNKSLRSVP